MNREIKFRGWSNNEMIYSLSMPDFSFWKWASYDSNTILMQYTGLKDKNGKEIYEGDILHGGMSKNGVVKFGNGTFTIWDEPIGWDIDSFDERPEPLSTENWAVIIGNIYENPELLTEKSLT